MIEKIVKYNMKYLLIPLILINFLFLFGFSPLPVNASQVNITFTYTGLNNDVGGATLLTIDNIQYSKVTFPLTFSWAVNSYHTIQVWSPILSTNNGEQYIFSGWTNGGTLSGSSSTYQVPSFSSTVTVIFQQQFMFDWSIVGSCSSCSVNISPTSNEVGNDYAWYNANQELTLSAQIASGYIFEGYNSANGGCQGMTNPCSFYINSYIFQEINFALTFSINSFTASINPDFVGQKTVFSVNAIGGVLPYIYTYSGLPTGCFSSDTSSLDCIPSSSNGSPFTIQAAVSDSGNSQQNAFASLTLVVSTLPTYSVTFYESNLPTSSLWSVTFNGQTLSSSTTNIQFTGVSEGTYSYKIGAISNYSISPSSGNITISNANVNQSIIFTLNNNNTYSVNFIESGLTSNTLWTVTFNNITKTSTTTSISFTGVEAGNYFYNVGAVSNYTVTPASGYITVSSSFINQNIIFTVDLQPSQTTTSTSTITSAPTSSSTSISDTLLLVIVFGSIVITIFSKLRHKS